MERKSTGDTSADGRMVMNNPVEAAALAKRFIGDMDRECLVVCAVDTKMKPTYIQLVTMGAVDYCRG